RGRIVTGVQTCALPILVGFSLGALIASKIAIRCPEKITSLTCVNAVCDRTPEESAQVAIRLQAARNDFANSMSIALEHWFPEDRSEERRVGNGGETWAV